jgi:RNA methyltransferase, TrmH family
MARYDKDDENSYAIGTTLTFELLIRKPECAKRVYISPKQKRDETYQKLLALAGSVPIIENNEKIFHESEGKESTMVIGEFSKFASVLEKKFNHVVLINPSNMGNLGTIFRAAAAFGIGGIAIVRPAADVFDPKTVRASMGALFSVPFSYYDSFEEYQKETGERAYYPFMLQAKNELPDIRKKMPYSLIFGNEATGLDEKYLQIGTPVHIPQTSLVDSLNLDNAVSIGLYSFTR